MEIKIDEETDMEIDSDYQQQCGSFTPESVDYIIQDNMRARELADIKRSLETIKTTAKIVICTSGVLSWVFVSAGLAVWYFNRR